MSHWSLYQRTIVPSLNDKKITIIHTPGHTNGCVCYKTENELYTGDTWFKESVGRWDFPTGNQRVLANSVVYIIKQFDDNTIIYPAQGSFTSIKTEKAKTNYYIHWLTGKLIPPDKSTNEPLFQLGKEALEKEEYSVAYDHFFTLSNRPVYNPLTPMYLAFSKSEIFK